MRGLLKFTLDLFAPPAPVVSRHPQSSQQTIISGQAVEYVLLRSRRRTMTFSISVDGLAVRAPYGMPQHAIESAVQEKGRWILRKLNGMQARQAQVEALKMDWQSGAVLDYLGQPMRVCVSPDLTHTVLTQANAADQIATLQLALPDNASEKKIRDATQKWLVAQATALYSARMNHFAPLLGVKWQSLRLSNAGTRWGSAKADGSIRLHWRLVQFSPEMVDYVVAHELSHLRELNHSPRFWAVLASVMPDYLAIEKKLKAAVLPPWM